ncbi:hypothetical protein amyaer_p04525 (plasmid) [Microcystis aeruginosa NIES-2481]|nr:hypothetical protein amyaer_p04525 [Microcystis aeruginosa NIES-2481]
MLTKNGLLCSTSAVVKPFSSPRNCSSTPLLERTIAEKNLFLIFSTNGYHGTTPLTLYREMMGGHHV